MPVEYRTGDLFSYDGNLAHGTNATGVMGKGIAVEFKKNFPNMYEKYKKLCKEGKHIPGMIYPYEDIKINSKTKQEIPDKPPEENMILTYSYSWSMSIRWIYNICIKPHWLAKAEPTAILFGLRAAVRHLEEQIKQPEIILFGLRADVRHLEEKIKRPEIVIPKNEIALPQIGCGLGGLNWERQVKPIIEEVGSATTCNLIVYLSEITRNIS